MHIVYTCSELFKQYLEVSKASVLKHNPDANIIVFEKPPEKILKIKGLEHQYGWVAYTKLLLPELLPYDKIIYLGADTICQGSLKDMWDMPCDYINACKAWQYGNTQAKELGIEYYINVDSMVMNLKALREDNFCEKVISNQSQNISFWCNEETLINSNYHDKIKLLPQKYNYAYNRKYDNPMPYSEAVILHFIGQKKEAMLNYPKNIS